MIQGVDFLGNGPTPAQLVAAGKRFTLGYIDRPDSTLTRAAIDARHAAGLDVGLIAEWGAQRMLGGAAAGTTDGLRAKRALAALGAPAGTVVYCAADWPATSSQMGTIDAYLEAFAAVVGQMSTGIYGGLAVIRHCMASYSASHFWQTYAWSGTPPVWAAGIHLRQYANHQTIAGRTVDLDDAPQANWGQWAVPLPDTASGDTPVTITRDLFPAPRGVTGTNVTLWLPDGTQQLVAALASLASGTAAIESDHAPKGSGWLLLAAKPYAGWYVAAASVTLDPELPDATPFSQSDLDNAKAAEHERTRAAAIAALEAI